MTMVDAIDSDPTGISLSDSRAVRGRVLVCEDDAAIRVMVSAILNHGQFEVVSVSDGVETIARLGDAFDVIILDLMMPSKSGYEVLDHLQETNPALLKRTIVVTAHAAVKRQPLQVPVAALLIKPFDIVEFMAAVTRIAGDS